MQEVTRSVSTIGVLRGLLGRELRTAFGASRLGYLWAIATPLAATGILVAVFSLMGSRAPYGTSLALFFGTGVMVIEVFTRISRAIIAAPKAARALMIYTPVRPLDPFLARLGLFGAIYSVMTFLFFAGLVIAGNGDIPHESADVAGAVLLMVLLAFGYGLVMASLERMWSSWSQIEAIATRPLMFLSASFYLPSALPAPVRDVLSWNPVMQGVELMRRGFYPFYDSAVLDPVYLSFVTLLVVAAGLVLERATRDWEERS